MVEQVNSKIAVDHSQVEKAIQAVTDLTQKIDRYTSSVQGVVRSTNQKNVALRGVAQSTKQAATAMEIFNKSSQDMTKSVQVALGPLSGVAARITAMTALFNRNNLAAASLIGTLTGFVVATKKLTNFAMETETALLRMEAVVAALGDKAAFTANSLELMAQKLTKATLASVSEAREVVTTLAMFDNIAPQLFEKATTAAYAFADVMGGQMAASVRQIGVLLEDPLRNIEMLRRRGVQFTQSEREKIEVLQRSGRVMEAQNIALEKFNVIVAQSEGKAKLLAGSLDRTSQLFNNFFQKVAQAGKLTAGVNAQIQNVNSSLERLLTSESFIQTWANVFSFASTMVAKALALITENIERLTRVLITFVSVITISSGIALIKFTGRILAASTAVRVLTVAFHAATAGHAIWAGKILLTATMFAGILGPLAVLAVSLGITAGAMSYFGRVAEETNAKVERIKSMTDEFTETLDALPTHVRLEFESNLHQLVSQLDTAREKVLLLDLEQKRSAMRQAGARFERRDRTNPLGGRVDIPGASPEEIEAMEKAQEEVKNLEDALADLRKEVELSRIAGDRYGAPNMDAAVKAYRELEESIDPALRTTREMNKNLEVLKNILDDIRAGNETGQGWLAAGIDEAAVMKLIADVAAGKDSSKKARDSWKGLADTFVDLQFEIEQTTNRLLGIEDALAIDPKLLRQFEQLTGGERSRLAGMGITPESMKEAQNIQKERADLEQYMTKIAQEQLSEAQKMTNEMNKHLGLIDNAVDLTEEQRQGLRDTVAAYKEIQIMEPFKELSKETGEQKLLNTALRQGQQAYERMTREIEINNKVAAERKRLTDLAVDDVGTLIAQYEAQLRVMARVSAENDKLIKEHERYAQLAQDLGSVIANSFEDAIVSGNGLRDVLQGLLDDLLRIATRVMITKPLESAFIGAMGGMGSGGYTSSSQLDSLTRENFAVRNAMGNVMTSSGPMPLKRYASGGIARTPQLAMFGEGSMNEAYVPLPDGRTIPVTMRGGSNVQVNIVNNVGAEVKTNVTEGAHGTSIDVMIDRAVAEKLADQGSSSNRSLRTAFGAKNTLTGR
jgi:hypothetical protein